MQILVGFNLTLQCNAETPILLALSPRPEEEHRFISSTALNTYPQTGIETFIDEFGNKRGRLSVKPGELTIWSSCIAEDHGQPDEMQPKAPQHPIEDLPPETLGYLAASRYCESDVLSGEAWRLFGQTEMGWSRVQAICDYVHNHITFGYGFASATKTALGTLEERRGVCRDFAHLAIAFCRAMNIPARYACGYLGDIGVPYAGPGDFCAWFEAFLGGRWYTFDARYNVPRIGRILIARGRDAADVAMVTSFGNTQLNSFQVWADEIALSKPPFRQEKTYLNSLAAPYYAGGAVPALAYGGDQNF